MEPTSITKHRRYTKRQKVVAISAAMASSTLAAAEQGGIPESTLRYWMQDPEFAELRDKARAELAPITTMAAYLAWAEAIWLLRQHKLEPHDVIFLAGMAADKSQLLSGAATHRLETKTLTDGLNDHEKAALRDLIDSALTESAEASAERDPVHVGAEVRE